MSVEHCDSLRPSLKAKLQDAGLLSMDDIVCAWNNSNNNNNGNENNSSAASLQHRCPQLTAAEAAEVIDCVGAADSPPVPRTLQDLLRLADNAPRVTTFCRALDVLLGGGVPVGGVAEVCGAPGAGKTQMLMQLAVSCALPRALGGLGGGCLFVDTEGSFVTERFCEIAAAAAAQVQRIIAQQEAAGIFSSGAGVSEVGASTDMRRDPSADDSSCVGLEGNVRAGPHVPGQKRGREEVAMPRSVAAAVGHFTVDHVMQQTQYARVLDAASLMALLYTLPDLLARHPGLRMLVIDSVAFPFRLFGHLSGDAEVDDEENAASTTGSGAREVLWQRSRLIFSCGQLLQEAARAHELCIVVSNHMTSRLTTGPGGDSMQVLVPALGDAWAYGIATRLLITHQHFEGERRDECHENIVFITSATVEGGSGVNAVQHRVARLVKSPTQLCGQCCFSVGQKGIRDVFRPSSSGT